MLGEQIYLFCSDDKNARNGATNFEDAAKTNTGEIVALGAYREDDHGISVFIANIEAHPESNPTISTVRKYAGIGRMMIA